MSFPLLKVYWQENHSVRAHASRCNGGQGSRSLCVHRPTIPGVHGPCWRLASKREVELKRPRVLPVNAHRLS